MIKRIVVFSLLMIFPIALPSSDAQEVRAINDDESQAMEQITERVNTSAITFLASDALKGRGTGSEGLQVAGAYVASRFRAAGLSGHEDSFFQNSTIGAFRTPSTGVVIKNADGTPIEFYGLFNGGSEEVVFEGTVETAEPKNKEKSYTGPVILEIDPEVSARRGASSIARTAASLKQRGATALIIPLPANNELVGMIADRTTRSRTSNRRTDSALPVLFVPQSVTANMIHILKLPAEIREVQIVSNVIGILEGSDSELKNEAVIFSAHLDHLGQRENGTGDTIYNGADDNASGVTGVMALADAYGSLKTPPKRTTIFIAYWGEERGFLGSRYLIDNPIWPLDKVVANVNLEMIGRPESGANGKAWMTGWEHSDLGQLMNLGSSRIEVEIFEHPSHSNRLYRSSDNWPFVQAGVVAHSFSAGSLHSDYHQPSDEWEKLDLRHMTLVCKGLFAATLPIADGDLTPKKRGSGK